jgi:hypothetical protein
MAAFLLAKAVTNAYHSRYMIGVLPGVAVGVASLLWRRFYGGRRVAVGILVMLGGYGAFLQARAALRADQIPAFGQAQQRTRTMLELENKLWADGKKYVVMPDLYLLFLEARYYSPHPERYAFFTDRAVKEMPHYPMTIWRPDDVMKNYRDAAFVEPQYEVVQMLQRAGVRAVLRYPGEVPVFYME